MGTATPDFSIQVCSFACRAPGVPYRRDVHAPVGCTCEGCAQSGRQLGQEALALDCCGLVRKVRSFGGDGCEHSRLACEAGSWRV